MKNGVSLTKIIQQIEKFSAAQKGVFTFADLSNLISATSVLQKNRIISRLVKEGILYNIKRGIYSTSKPDLWFLACLLKKDSYISLDTVLAKNGLIGTFPQYSLSLVYPGRKIILKTPLANFTYYSVQQDLLFGFEQKIPGLWVADSEKAYLDLLYAYTKGTRFVIDPLQEVNTNLLNKKKLFQYLKKYKNPKFIKFVKGLVS